MGRPRTKNVDLPDNIYPRRMPSGKTLYYYSHKGTKIPLGESLAFALKAAERMKIEGLGFAARNYGLLSEAEIVAESSAIGKVCGVYFLVRDERVTYIGQTLDIEDRVREHVLHGKKFDRYFWVPCHPDDRKSLEAAYIRTINPPENSTKPAAKVKFRENGRPSVDLRPI